MNTSKEKLNMSFEDWLKENKEANIREAFFAGVKMAFEQIKEQEDDKFTMMFGFDLPNLKKISD